MRVTAAQTPSAFAAVGRFGLTVLFTFAFLAMIPLHICADYSTGNTRKEKRA